VPQIDASSTSDHIWMYYGNASAPADATPAEVWSDGFEAVYHLGSPLVDTVTGVAAVAQATTATTGAIGPAHLFAGSPSWIHIGSDRPLLRNATQAMLSAWIKPSPLAYYVLVGVSVGTLAPTDNSRACLISDGTGVTLIARGADTSGGVQISNYGAWVSDTGWTSLVGLIDYSQGWGSIFVNGALAVDGPLAVDQPHTDDTNATTAAIGAEEDGTSTYYSGLIDEVRIAHRLRSAAWIAAEFRNQSEDSFVVFGDAEEL
jgi:biopolymer transport protein ExbB